METLTFLVITSILVIILIFLLINFKYLIKEIRGICEQPRGYFMFGQMIILFFAVASFIGVFIYTLFKNNAISSMDLILTVIVGILGTVIGLFFGGRAEGHISQPRKEAVMFSGTKHNFLRVCWAMTYVTS